MNSEEIFAGTVYKRKKTLMRTTTKAILILFILFLTLWISGLLGTGIRLLAVRLLLPFKSGEIEIKSFDADNNIENDASFNGIILVKPETIHEIAALILGWKYYLLPPLIIPTKGVLLCEWGLGSRSGGLHTFPFKIAINKGIKYSASINITMPASVINDELAVLAEKKWRKKKEWFLGHYERITSAKFTTLNICSIPHEKYPLKTRKFEFEATGTYRVNLKDEMINIRSTANINKMLGYIEASLVPDKESINLSYRIVITKLDANINNAAPWVDEKISKNIKESFESSLNKKNKEIKLPLWIPRDADVSINFK